MSANAECSTQGSDTAWPPADATALRRHLEHADLVALLATVAHLTRDPSLLREEWRPVLCYGVAESAMSPAVEAEVRDLCTEKLLAFATAGSPPPRQCGYDEVRRFCEWMMPSVHEGYSAMVLEDLVGEGNDPRRPQWRVDAVAQAAVPKVAIIGAGESGLLLGYRLKQAGVPFVILEKNPDVGGTWYENRYPGCRVDCNSFFYSYAFARHIWDDYYGHAADVQQYFARVAADAGLYEHIELEAEVTCCTWDAEAASWRLEYIKAGATHALDCAILVSAVGQLNRPAWPDIKGIDTFRKPSFHSAQWRHDVDLAGKRVAVIGTGASAAQIVPQLARVAAQVTVLARTATWLLPTPLLHEKVSDGHKWVFAHVPAYAMWYRATLTLPGAYGMLDGVTVDPGYPPTERAVSAANDAARAAITAWMEEQLEDRPDLRDFVIPTTPVGAKRIIRDNGTWIATLKKDNVSLDTRRISAIDADGVVFADGSRVDCDVLVYATGFQASKFLMPMTVTGEGGVDLHAAWDGDPRAYLGMTVPGFPNLYVLYGPNTNQVVHGGSAILWTEFSVKYVLSAIRQMLATGSRALSVKREVYDDYSARIDEANALRTWGFSSCTSWYKNAKGRVTQNFPFSSYEIWWRTHELNLADYEVR